MSCASEIITFQIGHYANFVGTHWWNLQEASFCYKKDDSVPLEINHDVLFKEGINPLGEVTYTPRLISVDLKGSLKCLRKEGTLYDVPQPQKQAAWEGAINVIKNEPKTKNDFLKYLEKEEEHNADTCSNLPTGQYSSADLFELDSTVDVWSDFLKVNLHPRSLCLIDEYSHDNKDDPFDIFECGVKAYENEEIRNMVENKLRQFAEECDYLQGFHILLDAYNGFSGVANCILQHLDDEYQRKARLCFPVFQNSHHMLSPEEVRKEQIYRLHSSLHSFSALSSYGSLFSPVSVYSDLVSFEESHVTMPHVKYNAKLPYHTSAILATALETITLPYRLKDRQCQILDVTESMSILGRKIIMIHEADEASSICLPFPLKEGTPLSSVIENNSQDLAMYSLTPFCQPLTCDTLVQSAVLRGIPKDKINRSPWQYTGEHDELFGRFLKKCCPSSVVTATVSQEVCKVTPPFPNIFKSEVDSNGYISSIDRPSSTGVSSVPICAALNNTNKAAQLIRILVNQANKTNFRRFSKCVESGVERDEFQEVLQSLMDLEDNYQPNFSM